MRLTAGASAHTLLAALERAGWGCLDTPDMRGVRVVLAALTRALDPRTAQGKGTAEQIARMAGYTPRWTRRCLHVLEELELLTWDRGGIVDGKPVPSWFRVSKQQLLALVALARHTEAERLTEAKAETRARVARYRLWRPKRRTRNSRSPHAEVISNPLSKEEVPRAAGPPDPGPPATAEAVAHIVAATRARLRAQRTSRPSSTRRTSAPRERQDD